MNKKSRYERWRKKLNYLVSNHGGLVAIARAARLKPKSVDQILKGFPGAGHATPPHLDHAAARQIEAALDLPEGWFDASAFLPSRLESDR
jgi:hypothetical protein